MTEAEMFTVAKSGKRQKKAWKRIINKMTFVGDNFTRKPPKFERFIRPMGLRVKKEIFYFSGKCRLSIEKIRRLL